MAMNGTAMGDAVAAAIQAVNPDANLSQIEPYWEAICTAIVTYMAAHATVTGIVTSGAGSGGAVTGTVA